jgi:hypothetical protein
MTGAMAAFGIAIGCTSLVGYVLMTRLQNSKRGRGLSGGNAGDGGNYFSGDSWNLAWFGRDQFASDSSVTVDSSGNQIDSGGGD